MDVTPGYCFEGLAGGRTRPRELVTSADTEFRSAQQGLDQNQAFQKILKSQGRRQVVLLIKSL